MDNLKILLAPIIFFLLLGGSLLADDQCFTSSLPDGVSKIKINHEGSVREYRAYIPQSYNRSLPLPVIINFHGTGSNADQQAKYSDLDRIAEDKKFIHINPQGKNLNGKQVFNAGLTMNSPTNKRDFSEEPRDDVSFTRSIISDLSSKICIDSSRVYATGMSNGGRMSYRLACEATDLFAAIAPVAGVLSLEAKDCNPSRPISTLSFHGTSDLVSRYDKPGGFSTISAPDMFALWAKKNNCSDSPEITFKKEDVTCQTYDSCGSSKEEITLCTIENGGHCWPGRFCFRGASYTINASEMIVDFFLKNKIKK